METMNFRMNAVVVGILYILGTVFGVLSVPMTNGLFSEKGGLVEIAANTTQLGIGAFFVFMMGLSLAAMTAFLYPVLKKKNESLALGMLIFRGPLEGSLHILTVVIWLYLRAFSKEFVNSGGNSESFQIIGNVLLQSDQVIGPISGIVFIIGAIFLYTLFYQTELIPRWISSWGILGSVLWLIVYIPRFFNPEINLIFFVIPLALQEMVMAFWLVIKGFNKDAVEKLNTKTKSE